MMDIATPVTRALTEKQIPFEVFQHPGKLHSLEQAAAERGQRPEQVVRSIVFRLSKDEYVMVLVAGPVQISWPALRHYLGQSRLTMADQEEILEVTGYKTGAVSPFGLPRPMRILVDENVLAEEILSIGSGVRGVAVILKSLDMLVALGEIEMGQFIDH